MVRRKGTRTSSFGVSRREAHDATLFYSRRLYADLKTSSHADTVTAAVIPGDFLDQVVCADSRDLRFLPDASAHLMVTSPPYNAAKEYDRDLSLAEYVDLLRAVLREVHRVLVPGGRACVNVANLGRKPYIPLHHYLIGAMLDLGFLMRGEIIWDKSASAGTSTAWGSWKSAKNPTIRDVHEYILVFSKEAFDRPGTKTGRDTISKDDFLEFTRSVWRFPTEAAKRVGHPAPFPVELPLRLIQLYTYEGDVVLDPFVGSGTTCIAALRARRHYLGVDNHPDYVALAKERIEAERERAPSGSPPRPTSRGLPTASGGTGSRDGPSASTRAAR